MTIEVQDIQVGNTIALIGANKNNLLTVNSIEFIDDDVLFAGVTPEGRTISHRLFGRMWVRVVG